MMDDKERKELKKEIHLFQLVWDAEHKRQPNSVLLSVLEEAIQKRKEMLRVDVAGSVTNRPMQFKPNGN